jgi:hypothetical protein
MRTPSVITFLSRTVLMREVKQPLMSHFFPSLFAVYITLSIVNMMRVTILNEPNHRRPTSAPKSKPFYGPVDWTPKGNLRTGIGSILV